MLADPLLGDLHDIEYGGADMNLLDEAVGLDESTLYQRSEIPSIVCISFL